MEKIVREALFSVIAIIIGATAIIEFKSLAEGSILIAIGLVIFGVNKDLRKLFLSFIDFLLKLGSKDSQEMKDSPHGIQLKDTKGSIVAGRDVYLGHRPNKIKKTERDILEYIDKKEKTSSEDIAKKLEMDEKDVIKICKRLKTKEYINFNKMMKGNLIVIRLTKDGLEAIEDN